MEWNQEETQQTTPEAQSQTRHHRWPVLIAALLIGILFCVLSDNLTLGPNWIVLVMVCILLVPLCIAIYNDHHRWMRRVSLTISSVLTAGLASSVGFLVNVLFSHAENAPRLLLDASILWVTNVVVFAIWYWELDCGGPLKRQRLPYEAPDFLFPQLAVTLEHWHGWKPTFVDYLFLAFNTSTAFSPTDTLVMSKRAKIFMMVQAAISLVVIAVLAARAINIA